MAETSSLSQFLGKSNNRKMILGVIVISVAVHLIGGIGAAIWIVARYFDKPEAVFESRPVVTLTPKIIDPKLAAAEFEAAASKPALDEKIASVRETDFALPDVPKLAVDQKVEFDPSALVESQIDAAASGFGSGAGGGGGGAGFSFFGMQMSGTRVIFLIDVSGSMVSKKDGKTLQTFNKVEDEVEKAVQGLTSASKYNLIVFGADIASYSTNLVGAGGFEDRKAIEWLRDKDPGEYIVRTGKLDQLNAGKSKLFDDSIHGSTRLDLALEKAFALNPDVIVVLSDGEPAFKGKRNKLKLADGKEVDSDTSLLKWVAERQKEMNQPTPINTIGYITGRVFMEKLAKANGGTFKHVESDK